MFDKKQKYNGEFKTIDTEIKAYFLGFAFGDGCNTYKKGYKFVLATTYKDIEIFKIFYNHFPFFKLCTYKSKPNVIYLENYEKSLVKDLKFLGLTQNKTKQDKKGNFNFPILDEKYISHFIRGFFDADGTVYTPNRERSRNNIKTEIALSTKNFCNQMKSIINSNDIVSKYRERTIKLENKIFNSYGLYITSRKESLKFANYIYKDASYFLKRKKEIFYKYKKSELQKRKDLFPPCPYCKESDIGSGAIRNNKQRLICKSCNKNYTVELPL